MKRSAGGRERPPSDFFTGKTQGAADTANGLLIVNHSKSQDYQGAMPENGTPCTEADASHFHGKQEGHATSRATC
ncbi:hypothetical protein EZX59_14975 [Salmonella enterica]|nr:hypothetical protein [Salmonella enterica]